jgi:hypothetical protein
MTEVSAFLGAQPRAGPPRDVSTSRGGASTTFQTCGSLAIGTVLVAMPSSSGECRLSSLNHRNTLFRAPGLRREQAGSVSPQAATLEYGKAGGTSSPRLRLVFAQLGAIGDLKPVRLSSVPVSSWGQTPLRSYRDIAGILNLSFAPQIELHKFDARCRGRYHH